MFKKLCLTLTEHSPVTWAGQKWRWDEAELPVVCARRLQRHPGCSVSPAAHTHKHYQDLLIKTSDYGVYRRQQLITETLAFSTEETLSQTNKPCFFIIFLITYTQRKSS